MSLKEKTKLLRIPISRITPNPSQPRRVFDRRELESLAMSISENGLLQPITVRREGKNFVLISGERRLRASKMAGQEEIPAILTKCDPSESAVLALIENIQRKDLQMFEQANAMVNLLREWEISQEQAAKRLGMSQSYLANKIRLLKLSPQEQEDIIKNGLTERHARALLRISDMSARQRVLKVIIERGLNVQQTEELIEDALEVKRERKKPMRTFIAKDIRLFINTIDHAVDVMKTAGIDAWAEKTETEEYIECKVRIPKVRP